MSGFRHPEELGESGKLVLSNARLIARELGSSTLDTPHLFLGVMRLEDVIIKSQFAAQGIGLAAVVRTVRERLRAEEGGRDLSFDGLIKALDDASWAASHHARPLIEAPHILIGVLRDRDGLVVRLLKDARADIEKLDRELFAMVAEGKWSAEAYRERRAITQPEIGTPSEVLESLGRDLTAAARGGRLSPIIGRDGEMLELIHVLCGKRKQNAVLIGEAGVGKTAIVEGLAQRIVSGEIPDQLKDMTVRTIEVGSLVAGTMYRGQFEERLVGLVSEIRARSDVILFIDEMHTLIGAGRAEGVAADAADMLKPVLGEGTIKVIGATTTEEFRKYIESDKALMRRFQQVVVGEPTREATTTILEGLAPKYEKFHGVLILGEALAACIELSVRHMHGRFLPDKALDLLDRACTQEKLEVDMKEWMPALAPDIDPGAAGKPVVDEGDVADVVSVLLEIPTATLTSDERQRLLGMGDALKARVIGQDEAVDTVAKTMLAVRMGTETSDRPHGVFLFLGPTGVGKTRLAEELAAYLFGEDDELIRFDMSEFAEQHSISGLIGAPPGYGGWEEGGRLTNAVRSKPYSVLLLDEIEKAHPEVWNVFLGMFDEGRLTDTAGRRVDFRNTTIVMTSNVGARQIQASKPVGFTAGGDERALSHEEVRRAVDAEVKRVFPPEFLNRMDEVLIFRPLSKADLRAILSLLVQDMINLDLELSEAALDFLVEKSYEPAMGARPARRTIQRLLRNPLSLMLAREEIAEGEAVTVGLADGALTFKCMPARQTIHSTS